MSKQEIVGQRIQTSKKKKSTTLNLSNLGLREFPEKIIELTHLKSLYLGGNNIQRLPADIVKLEKLERLSLSGNRFTLFPMVVLQFPKLIKLSLRGNGLRFLPDGIDKLVNLENLDLSKNVLTALPNQLAHLKKLKLLDLRDNPLELPLEILDKHHQAQEILAFLFPGSGISMQPLNEVKLIFVGQGSVGKTSLVRRLVKGDFASNETKTEGISINHWQVPSKSDKEDELSQIQLNIWDFGGQEIMHATHQFFLTKRSLYILVLDSRLTQVENRVEYWLKIIQSFGDESPILIIGNKTDQHPLDIDRTGLQKKHPSVVGILETSAATGTGIEEFKNTITELVNQLSHIRDLMPENWFTVKNRLEELGREQNYIINDRYLDLCTENDIDDEISQRTLIGFLHDLGVILYFQDDPRLEALGILNPQWVANGVYKILNSHALFHNKGILERSMLNEILDFPEYPANKRLFIVDMMRKFELCYDIEADNKFLIPDLLPNDEPELNFNSIPAFEYAYPILPSSVITRFIVRMNQKIDDGFVWRTGVLLKIGENRALVKADLEDRKITIAIDGLEHTRRDTLSAIRYQLDEIHESIKGLEPQKRVPVPNAPNAEALDYDYLLQLERDGFVELPIKDGNRLVKINVRQMLSGVESETQRRNTASKVTNINIIGNVDGSTIVTGDENELNA